MTKGRKEAFSDGVIAIVITITILLIDVPEGNGWNDLYGILPLAGCYLISFIIVGANWVNHHHLLQVTEKISGKILWANLLYLFFLSFMPVATGWVGRTEFSIIPVRVYVIVNLAIALSYWILEKAIAGSQDADNLKAAIKASKKEYFSIGITLLALICSFVPGLHYASCPLLVVADAPWIIPDIRMTRMMENEMKDEDDQGSMKGVPKMGRLSFFYDTDYFHKHFFQNFCESVSSEISSYVRQGYLKNQL